MILTDPLKFWVITLIRLPENVTGLRYQTSETAASTTALVELFVAFAFVFSFGVSVGVNMKVAATVGVSDSAFVVITGIGFKSGL